MAWKNGQFRGNGYAIREMHANAGRPTGLIPSVFLSIVTLPREYPIGASIALGLDMTNSIGL
jgi:hypothetical protein